MMRVVRKQLANDQIQPAGTRYNPMTDTVQTTPDGGTTWNDAPGLDIRHADSFRLPPLTGDAQCDAAARMAAYVNIQVDNFLNSVSLAQAATGALGILLIFAGGAGIIIDAIIAAMDVLITIGTTAISSAFSVDTYEALKCTFYCHLSVNGQMSAQQFLDFQDDVHLHYSTVVYDTMIAIGSFTGEVQYSNAAVERSETGDCSACNCVFSYCWDFVIEDYAADGWAVEAPYGEYAPTQGWRTSAGNGLILDLTFPAATEVQEVQWGGTAFGGSGPFGRAVLYTLAGVTVFNSNESGISNPYTQDVIHTDTVDKLRFNPYGGSTADIYIQNVKVTTTTEVTAWAARLC